MAAQQMFLCVHIAAALHMKEQTIVRIVGVICVGKIWMKVTADKYELPLVIADSSRELAEMCGTTANSIVSAISHHKKGRTEYSTYVCVQVEEGDE